MNYKRIILLNKFLIYYLCLLYLIIAFDIDNHSWAGLLKKHKDMVYFPAGDFMMGSSDGDGRPDERPKHKVFLDSFYLDKHEATGIEFEEYLMVHPKEHPTITGWFDRKVKPEMKDRPVIGLTWKRCLRYCKWRGKRIPTEAEWERAAAGLEGRVYPWGNRIPTWKHANFNKCCSIMKGLILDIIGSHRRGTTPEGVYDLAGNIAEWVHDWYDKKYYEISPQRNPSGPIKGTYHVIRGGAWNSIGDYLRSSARYGYNDANNFYGIGCRCAKSINMTLAN
tara:strand:+ start:6912 stop:7748 length:837 start_codon:yes stop_codon:yes gene_type:complete